MVMQLPYPMGMQPMGADPRQAQSALQTAYSGMSQPMPNLQAGALETSLLGAGGGNKPGGRFSAPPGWKDARMARIEERRRMKGDNQPPMQNPTGGPLMPGGPMRPAQPMPASPVGGPMRPAGPLPGQGAMPGGNMPPPPLGGGANGNLPAMGANPTMPPGKPVGPLPKRPVGPGVVTNQGGRY